MKTEAELKEIAETTKILLRALKEHAETKETIVLHFADAKIIIEAEADQ